MVKIAVAIDGSKNSLRAAAHIVGLVGGSKIQPEIHLLNVQSPLHGGIAGFIDAGQIRQYHQEEGLKALAEAKALLDRENIPHHTHLFVGEPAETIVRFAKENACDEIVLGTRGFGGVTGMLMGSVANKILQLSEIPVLFVK